MKWRLSLGLRSALVIIVRLPVVKATYWFSYLPTCSAMKVSWIDKSFVMCVWYRANVGSIIAKSPLIYWITIFESLKSLTFLAFNFFVVKRSVIVVSYCASLLVQVKSILKDNEEILSIRWIMTNLTPHVILVENPSK